MGVLFKFVKFFSYSIERIIISIVTKITIVDKEGIYHLEIYFLTGNLILNFEVLQSELTVYITPWKVSKYGVFSGPYFLTFGLNTERYFVSLRSQSKCGKIRTRKSSVFGHISHSIWVCWNPLLKKFCRSLKQSAEKSQVSSFAKRKLWLIVSNTFDRSYDKSPIWLPSSICCFQVSIICKRHYLELWVFLKSRIAKNFRFMKLSICLNKLLVDMKGY